MAGLVGVRPQRVHGPPHAEIDQNLAVVEHAQRRRVAVGVLEAPDEAGRPLGEQVDGVEGAGELSHYGPFHGALRAGDVDLSEVHGVSGRWGARPTP